MTVRAHTPSPLRITLSKSALIRNFTWFQNQAAVPAICAIKADGYGLGAREVARHLLGAGARCFAVSTWWEAASLNLPDVPLVVLHGFTPDCAETVRNLPLARPVLVTPKQCRDWATYFPGRPADVMVDTGMNRLGLSPAELDTVNGFPVEILHSHLACADEPDSPMTLKQLALFQSLSGKLPIAKRAIANSAGICWGPDFSFDHVRPGLGIYGGVPHDAAKVEQVVSPAIKILQIRTVRAGETVGYGGTWMAHEDTRVAIVNIGYADGIPRQLAGRLEFNIDTELRPAIGRISMDMTAVDIGKWDLTEGDWLPLNFDLPKLTNETSLSQYELLTGLSGRYDRNWI